MTGARIGPVPEIRTGDVHIWRAHLDPPEATLQQLERVISQEECERAARFHFERDRRRYIAARGILRTALGHYLRRSPRDIRFGYESAGKPYLMSEGAESRLRFNVSHSRGQALIAFCLERRIGVDIEFKDRDRATLEVATHFFAPEEVATLRNLPEEEQCNGFFSIWTLKEAYIKGRGEGVSLGLDTFAMTIGSGKPPELLRSAHGQDELRRWRFWTLDAGTSYAAALAVEEPGEQHLSFWNAAGWGADGSMSYGQE